MLIVCNKVSLKICYNDLIPLFLTLDICMTFFLTDSIPMIVMFRAISVVSDLVCTFSCFHLAVNITKIGK